MFADITGAVRVCFRSLVSPACSGTAGRRRTSSRLHPSASSPRGRSLWLPHASRAGGSLAPRGPLPPLLALGGRCSLRSLGSLLPPARRGSLRFGCALCPSLRSRPPSSPLSRLVARAGTSPLPRFWVLPLSAPCGRMATALRKSAGAPPPHPRQHKLALLIYALRRYKNKPF